MKISLNWLQQYIENLSGPEALAEELTFAGVEVEGVETSGVNFPHVVVAQILSSEPHPNADRLSVCKVDDGSSDSHGPRQIVCGAKNYSVGDKVPLAQPGAVLPGNFRIKVGKLRGVESEGMLCSAKELGIPAGDADAGLLILPAESKVGTPIGELFPSDTIFDLEVTPNRPDLLSHAGIARELAALKGRKLNWPQLKQAASQQLKEGDSTLTSELQLTVAPEAKEVCPFYTARLIKGVKVAPSPEWLRHRLESVGIRSINNIVDITNFILLEIGQPLHAFDADKIQNFPNIEVRFAHPKETILALDGKSCTLDSDQLVIAENGENGKAMAIAGVMGGTESSVTNTTQNIVLESAYFQPSAIRRTSRKLNLSSDSSYRFERGVDPNQVQIASERAVELILEIAGGTVYPLTVAKSLENQFLPSETNISISYDRCRQLLGVSESQISNHRLEEIFTHLGLKKQFDSSSNQSIATWTAPTYRQDLKREVDLFEEVTRVIGLDNVPSRTRALFVKSTEFDQLHNFQMQMRQQLSAIGFSEVRTATLISEAATKELIENSDQFVHLKNPLNEEQGILRPSLLPGLLAVIETNTRIGINNLRLFEIGRIFSEAKTTAKDLSNQTEGRQKDNRPEPLRLAFAMTGQSSVQSWQSPVPNTIELQDLEAVIARITSVPIRFKRQISNLSAWAVEVEIIACPDNDAPIVLGQLGQVKPSKAQELNLRTPLILGELSLDLLFNFKERVKDKKFTPLQRFPSMNRDLAFVVNKSLTHQEITDALKATKEPLLTDIQLFDVFTDPTGEKIPSDKKSLAYSLTYQAADRTLKSEEVQVAHERLKTHLASQFSLRFRE